MKEIDVSKCEFYNNNYCSCYKDNYGDCYHKCTDEELKDCNYKQLQQLKAENEELKKIQLGHSQGENLYNLYQYKQCLGKIEEICKENKKCKVYNPDVDIVLQKIKEVRNG